VIHCLPAATAALALSAPTGWNPPAPAPRPGAAPGASVPPGAVAPEESRLLSGHVQLTSRDAFVKAGEAYFDHHSPPRWIIFQAVPVPPAGREPDPFYSMYVARLTRNAQGEIVGIGPPVLVSPPGSANTCGWFHPSEPGLVMFGSTLRPPAAEQAAGFQVGTRKYVWQFPEETEVCVARVALPAEPTPGQSAPPARPEPLFTRAHYDAECTWSPDGRHVLYTHVREPKDENDRPDADIWVYDTRRDRHTPLVEAPGYDGGPFFSPDGTMICYRSDRRLDDRLQVFVARLERGPDGAITGLASERQLTDDSHVNFGPFWHPSGRFLAFGSSAVGHHNYEVFAIEVDLEKKSADLRQRRVTHAPGADLLPAFSDDGALMMWTAQRGPLASGETRPSSQVWLVRVRDAGDWLKETPPAAQPAPDSAPPPAPSPPARPHQP